MEFFRRWGVADAVRTSGTPQDFTSRRVRDELCGYEIARIDRPGHVRQRRHRDQSRTSQRWQSVVARSDFTRTAKRFPSIDLRYRTRFESFTQDAHGVDAVVRDLATGVQERVRAQYLIACCGAAAPSGRRSASNCKARPRIEYNLNIFVRIDDLWAHTSVAEAAMSSWSAPEGIWRTLIDIDGRGLWRLGLRGKRTMTIRSRSTPPRIAAAR